MEFFAHTLSLVEMDVIPHSNRQAHGRWLNKPFQHNQATSGTLLCVFVIFLCPNVFVSLKINKKAFHAVLKLLSNYCHKSTGMGRKGRDKSTSHGDDRQPTTCLADPRKNSKPTVEKKKSKNQSNLHKFRDWRQTLLELVVDGIVKRTSGESLMKQVGMEVTA